LLPIIRHFVNLCWFFFKCALMLGAAAAVAAGFYLYRHSDELIRCRAEVLIAKHYAKCGLKSNIASAQLIQGEGIRIHGLTITETGAAGPRGELLSLEEVRLACNTNLQDFLAGQLEVTEVVARRPKLWATRRPDGSWSSAKLLPWPSFGKHPPTVKIENGTIEIFDPLSPPSSTLVFRDVNLTLTPPPPLNHASPEDEVRRIQGTLSGDHFRQLAINGSFDPRTRQWSLGGTLEGLDVSPELHAALPAPWAAQIAPLAALRGQIDLLTFRVNYDPLAPAPYTFDVSGHLSRGRIEDPRLPHALTDVQANLHCDNQGYRVDQLVARDGQCGLWLSCRHAGYASDGPMTLVAEVRQFDLDWQWLRVLPDGFRELRDRYVPMGQIDADLTLTFDGRQWHPDLTVHCNSLSFTYRDFQYRLECGKGVLELKNDVLRVINLTAQSGNHSVRIDAEVQHPLTPAAAVGYFTARTAQGDDLPLDEKLAGALPPRGAAIFRALDPHGSLAFYFRVSRDRPGEPAHKFLRVDLHRCAIQFDQFPYPIGNICGALIMNDDHWTFDGLQGSNSTGQVTLKEGSLANTPAGSELTLLIEGKAIPLEKDLRDALAPTMQQFWEKLRPHGAVNLDTKITYLSEKKQLGVTVWAQPQGDSTWIEPVVFPYRMEKLRGQLMYNNENRVLTLTNLRAEHGSVSLRHGNGVCRFLPDGSWDFHLDDLAVDRIALDRELTAALPGRLRRSLAELNPTGPCNLDGTCDFLSGGQAGDPVQSGWNVRIGFQRGGIDCGVKLDNLHGEVGLVGGFNGQNMQCRGELAIDSLTCHDVQLTEIKGPFKIDDQRVSLGSWVDDPRQGAPAVDPTAAGRKPRPLTAKVCGGTLLGDGYVALGTVPHYHLEASLSQADLAQCVRETSSSRQNLRGKIAVEIKSLEGTGRGLYSLHGYGSVHLREADIYELPLMIRLLKLLSVRPPDSAGFSEGDVDFIVAGPHVELAPIVFRGDAISLQGKGEMGFDSQIHMTLHAMIGRGDLNMPVLRDVSGKASEQIMLVHVDGTLQDPQVKNEPLPMVNRFLQILQINH
jgi:hypothetical protein